MSTVVVGKGKHLSALPLHMQYNVGALAREAPIEGSRGH